MTELPTRWQRLPLHQKIKYIAELTVVCGGLLLLILNLYQLKLLAQQNAINYEILKLTFPIEIESTVIDYKDGEPLVLRVRLTNMTNQTVSLQTLTPKFVLSGSNEIRTSLSEIETKIYKQNNALTMWSPYSKEGSVTLKPYEGCILGLTASLKTDVYHDKEMIKYNAEMASFIMIPTVLRDAARETSRTLIVSLTRDKNRVLLVSCEIKRITDDKLLLQEAEYMRSRVGFLMRNPADIPDR